MLTQEQKDRAVQLMQEYLAAKNPDGKKCWEENITFDAERREVIKSKLMPLLAGFLAGETPLGEFKSGVDSINKSHNCWGFRGFNGQMFFNMLFNWTREPNYGISVEEFVPPLQRAIAAPQDEAAAKAQLSEFADFVRRQNERIVELGNPKSRCVNPGSVPFFLSYFWQVQAPDVWPVYYKSSVTILGDANLWSPGEDLAENYLAFKHLHEELVQLFTTTGKQPFGLYEVEHVFWLKHGLAAKSEAPAPVEPAKAPKGQEPAKALQVESAKTTTPQPAPERLPDSYVPPIVAILPRMAVNDPALATAAKNTGTSLERAFEKHVHAAFTILGYDTLLLGQGQGRVPDGRALDEDNSYAVIWDAKVRTDGYSMGTDDRTIREYIATQSRELKRRRSLRNIYYVLVSSTFKDDYEEAIRAIKMETHVNEVCLIQVDALVAMVEAKLRDPRQVDLGSSGLQRLFCLSGILTGDMVREALA
ncbi:MAG: restriction endonuclease FokI C-terminal domain-containing protein [Humidesulfovibrio sp.]|nr:restriction endonuclease FokI C-terminal domain-containing protein [Humidesulfovibrio sp.]